MAAHDGHVAVRRVLQRGGAASWRRVLRVLLVRGAPAAEQTARYEACARDLRGWIERDGDGNSASDKTHAAARAAHAQDRVGALLGRLGALGRADLVRDCWQRFATGQQVHERVHNRAVQALCAADAVTAALDVYDAMVHARARPSSSSLFALVHAHARRRNIGGVADTLQRALKADVRPSRRVLNRALDSFAAAGAARPAARVVRLFVELGYERNADTAIALLHNCRRREVVQDLVYSLGTWPVDALNETLLGELVRTSLRVGDWHFAWLNLRHVMRQRRARNRASFPELPYALVFDAAASQGLTKEAHTVWRIICFHQPVLARNGSWRIHLAQLKLASQEDAAEPDERRVLRLYFILLAHRRDVPQRVVRSLLTALAANEEQTVLMAFTDRLVTPGSTAGLLSVMPAAHRWPLVPKLFSTRPGRRAGDGLFAFARSDRGVSARTASVLVAALAAVGDRASILKLLRSSAMPPLTPRLVAWLLDNAYERADVPWVAEVLRLAVRSDAADPAVLERSLAQFSRDLATSQSARDVGPLVAELAALAGGIAHGQDVARAVSTLEALPHHVVHT